MNLLSKTKSANKVQIFSVLPNQKIKEYKESYIEQIPYDERILLASTSGEKPLETMRDRIIESSLKYRAYSASGIWGPSFYHTLDRYVDVHSEISGIDYDERYKEVVTDYINGGFVNASAKIIYDYIVGLKGQIDTQYLLITDRYRRLAQNRAEYMHNIIQITKELYLLQLLEQGQFHKLIDEDIEEQLELFNIDPIKEIQLESAFDLDMYGFLPGTYNSILWQAEVGQRILSKKK